MSSFGTSRVEIEKFNGKSFELWKLKMEDLLVDRDLWTVIEDKKPKEAADSETESEAAETINGGFDGTLAKWEKLDRKARGLIRLCLADSVLVNVAGERTAKDLWLKLEGLYQSKSLVNKLFLRKKLYKLRMEEGDSFATHLNEFNTLVSQLQSINYRIQDDDKAITLLCSLPDSWDNLIMAIGSGTTTLSFDSVVAALLSEDMRRQNVDSSSKEVLMARGRTREKGTGRGTGRSKSRDKGKTRKELTCWKCGQSGHFKRECKDSAADKGKKKVEDEESSSEEEGSLYSVGSQIDSWVMDSGASFHASPKKDSMRNFKSGKFGKVRLADGKTLEITGIGDVDLKTSVGTTWTLKDVRVIPSLKKKLISVG